MEKLEQITKDTCATKVQVMRMAYVSEDLERCKNCTGNYYETCERYKPVSRTQIAFRRGANAIYSFWLNNISIKGLPHEL